MNIYTQNKNHKIGFLFAKMCKINVKPRIALQKAQINFYF